MKFTMTKIAAGLVLAVAATAAQAAPVSSSGVFNMYSQDGYDLNGQLAGTEGAINVDSSITAFVDKAAGTWGVSSTTPFFGLQWTASNGKLIMTQGSYSLNTTTGVVGAGTGVNNVGVADGIINFNVGVGQVAGLIDFAWGATTGIKVVNVWTVNPNGSVSALGVPGMENGPFPGFNAAFNLTAPGLVPEASTYGMMLAGLGLVGAMVSRRRKLMA